MPNQIFIVFMPNFNPIHAFPCHIFTKSPKLLKNKRILSLISLKIIKLSPNFRRFYFLKKFIIDIQYFMIYFLTRTIVLNSFNSGLLDDFQ